MIKYTYECERNHTRTDTGSREAALEILCVSCGEKMTLVYMVSEYQYPEKKN